MEQDLLNSLIRYLVKQGYPLETLVVEWAVGSLRFDLAVIDPYTKEAIALFQIKSDGLTSMRNSFQRHVPNLHRIAASVLIYFVYANVESESIDGFTFIRVRYNKEDGTTQSTMLADSVLSYETIRRSRFYRFIAENKENRQKTFDWFQIVCWAIAALLGVLGLLHYLKIITISTIELTLVGASVALILVPFASKLKILGVEFERLKDSKNHNDQA